MWMKQIEMEPNRKGRAVDSCRDLNCISLHFTIARVYGTNMSEMVEHRKRDGKMA